MSSRVVIEVGLNENQDRAANPRVPYSAEELAAEARRCSDAGAAVVHYHARRGAEGTPALSDPELNLAAQRAIAKAAPLIAYPSYAEEVRVLDWYELGTPAPERYRHIRAGIEAGVRWEIAPVDLGAFDTNAAWDARAARQVPSRGVLLNTGEDQRWMLELCRAHSIRPQFTAFDTNHLQSLRNVLDWGWVASRSDRAEALPGRCVREPGGAGVLSRASARDVRGRRAAVDAARLRHRPVPARGALARVRGARARGHRRSRLPRARRAAAAPSWSSRSSLVARAFGREPASADEARALMGLEPTARARDGAPPARGRGRVGQRREPRHRQGLRARARPQPVRGSYASARSAEALKATGRRDPRRRRRGARRRLRSSRRRAGRGPVRAHRARSGPARRAGEQRVLRFRSDGPARAVLGDAARVLGRLPRRGPALDLRDDAISRPA